MRKLRSCGVLVVRGDPVRQFLLMVHPDRLDLPKGHVDPGETDLQCALRELEEETSIPASALQILDGFRFRTEYVVRPKKYGGEPCDKTLVVFLGRLSRDVEIRPTEHEGFRWVDWQPPHRLQPQTIDPLLAALEKYLAAAAAE